MWPTVNSSHTVSIHTLDDDSLLHIFYLYRPVVIFRGKKYDGDEEEEEEDRNYGRTRIPEQWWYKLSRVCQRWRKILLGSASYLDLCLVCTYGTPVEDMLEHSPPLPLVIDFFRAHWDITTEDEEGIILAFERRDRVRRVRLLITPQNLHNLFVAFFEEYPVLESLIMTLDVPVEHDTAIVLPELQTPHLRHLMLRRFVLPIESRLLATAVGLVTLSLYLRVGFGHFNPDTLFQILQSISFMPQLETLIFVLPCRSSIGLHSMLLGHTSSMTQRATLSNLRRLVFEGVKECIEAVVCHIAAPLLETLDVHVFDQLMLSEFSPHVPGLFQFVKTTENLKFDCAKFKFLKEGVRVDLYPRREAKTHSFSIYVHNNYRRQVYLMADLLNTSIGSGEMFSTVEHLVLEDRVHRQLTGTVTTASNGANFFSRSSTRRPFTSTMGSPRNSFAPYHRSQRTMGSSLWICHPCRRSFLFWIIVRYPRWICIVRYPRWICIVRYPCWRCSRICYPAWRSSHIVGGSGATIPHSRHSSMMAARTQAAS
jgi:hypothetical protein